MADLIEREPLLEKMFPSQQKRLVEEAPAVNRWIPCSEKLPERGEDVLVYFPRWEKFDSAIQVGRLLYDGSCWDICGEFNPGLNEITHWMPLPPTPESGATS